MSDVRVTTGDAPEVLARFHAELDLVDVVARRVRRSLGASVEFDDLMSAGREGLWEAARRFDPESGTPFKAYAQFRVRGAMLDSVRRHGALSRRMYERVAMSRAALHFRESTLNAAPNQAAGQAVGDAASLEVSVAAQLAGMATAAAIAAEEAARRTGNAPPESASPEQSLERAELLAEVKKALHILAADEAEVVRRHYFGDELLEDIAAEVGMSKSWASRLHARAIQRLTKLLRSELKSPESDKRPRTHELACLEVW
jgi:RNA polymerase sigma factor for flagellar operon FliA